MVFTMEWLVFCTVFYLYLTVVWGDVYLHNPRGSNNRLNEQSAERTNANRVFDSQNNDRGGYNVGDLTDEPFTDEDDQYQMKYFQSGPYKQWESSGDSDGQSFLTVEWTNQHGCGGSADTDPHKQNCQIILQYMCQDDSGSGIDADDVMRDGTDTDTQDYRGPSSLDESSSDATGRKSGDVDDDSVIQESWEWYDKCYVKERNSGLFVADRYLQSNDLGYSSSIYTRQNPSGERSGYECPEERDYYPYWHPTPWKDIAVLTDNTGLCGYYTSNSFNTAGREECVEYWSGTNRKHYSQWNNGNDCEDNNGEWMTFYNYLEKATDFSTEAQCTAQNGDEGMTYFWAVPYDGDAEECLVALDDPDCLQAPWTRSNHLGNGPDGVPSNYTWVLPYFPSGETYRCVLRVRYNISTDDYDGFDTFSESNGDQSPVEKDPLVDIGANNVPLQLAIDTTQLGRTFQDRSHLLKIAPRPDGTEENRIHNLNVRGKRGNIVQVYPAVEYDFIPNQLEIDSDKDLVHVQWTGSNTHDNGSPGGDGQTGDDGEGDDGTDRSNIVEIPDRILNYPYPFEQTTLWSGADIVWSDTGDVTTAEDLAVNMASAGYYSCMSGCYSDSADTKDTMDNLLNNAPASYAGVLLKLSPGTYHYMCTRNNNFTNRSQKGSITVQ